MLYKENDIRNKSDKVSAFSRNRSIIVKSFAELYRGSKHKYFNTSLHNTLKDETYSHRSLRDYQFYNKKTVKKWAYDGNYAIDKAFNDYRKVWKLFREGALCWLII